MFTPTLPVPRLTGERHGHDTAALIIRSMRPPIPGWSLYWTGEQGAGLRPQMLARGQQRRALPVKRSGPGVNCHRKRR